MEMLFDKLDCVTHYNFEAYQQEVVFVCS